VLLQQCAPELVSDALKRWGFPASRKGLEPASVLGMGEVSNRAAGGSGWLALEGGDLQKMESVGSGLVIHNCMEVQIG